MRLDNQCEGIIRSAVTKAMLERNIYVMPEHMLYGMAGEKEFARVFKGMGGNIKELVDDLEDFFHEMVPKFGEDAPLPEQAEVSASFTSVIEVASETALSSGNDLVGMQHLLWGIYEQPESFATYYVEKHIGDKQEFIFRLQSYLEDMGQSSSSGENAGELAGFATRLNDIYKEKNPVIGREKELERTIQILMRKDKNNPLYTGESGVGKTAMAYGLARKIEEGDVPAELKNASVYMLDVTALVSGTQYRGEFEKRIKLVMDLFLEKESPIVFIDDIHTLIGAGGMSGNAMDATSVLVPYLEGGRIRFIGTCSYNDYKKYVAKNTAFSRRFQKIDLKEPSAETTLEILEGLKKNYEKFHKVRYAKGVTEYAVELSNRFIHERFLPDKAIDLLDEAGVYRHLNPVEGKKYQMVDRDCLEQVLSLAENVPLQTAKESETSMLAGLYDSITSKIFGQDKAVRSTVDAICMSRAGLLDDHKPIASLLFVGPTGVGKTEVAKVLSEKMDMPLIRFDMSEYAEKHTASKLIGAPAGYVGYEEGGLLTDAIRRTPHAVLLLDEIEKAHADIYNVLLQVMDYASLTDSKGQKADFSNVIIIMTSNAGARMIGKKKIGFKENEYDNSIMMDEVKRVFAPEFRNRLSAIVSFSHVNEDMANAIVDKKISELNNKLAAKKVALEVSKDVQTYIAAKGVSVEYGAREIERIINNEVKPLLVNELLFGKLKKGGTARLVLKDHAIVTQIGRKRS